LDEFIGEGRWKAFAAVPRVGLVKSRPRVIALMYGADARRQRLAGLAGCFDAVDVTSSSWRADLREAVRFAYLTDWQEAQVPHVAAQSTRLEVVR
jgi:hypothetical protein